VKFRQLYASGGLRTFVLVFDIGDEVSGTLLSFAREQGISGASFTAIGAFSEVVFQWFDWQSKQYRDLPLREQVEVLMLAGDVALQEDGQPKVHAHGVVGTSDGSARGGHLARAIVRPTLELILTETPTHLRRRHDPATGLALIRLEEPG
jgi:predicted DNA-binding protein with PD1-like motif